MPSRRLRYCLRHGCSALVEEGYCSAHSARPNADVRKFYNTARWRRLREDMFQADPFCVDCRDEGQTRPWTDLDHERPHRGDLTLFWDESNLRGRCHEHHAAKTGRGQ